MQLTIEGIPRQFEPIKGFRATHDLPPEFGIALFEPKDFSGLGRIDQAGAELNSVRAAVLGAIPPALPLGDWLTFIPELTAVFIGKLYEINPVVKLHEVEIEFAAAGFADVCQAVVYALLRGAGSSSNGASFEAIYGEWLDNSARVSQTIHPYRGWQVQIITHAYGRAGMIVQTGDNTHYVADSALGCPAEGYMAALLAEVAARIMESSR